MTKNTEHASPMEDPIVHHLLLMPPPHPKFHNKMGGLPKEISERTFHAASGTCTICEFNGGRTALSFSFEHLLPYGVYTLWDVTKPNWLEGDFADRPLADIPGDAEFDKDGGPDGFGSYGFMADQNGRAHVVVHLNHRPGKEFLLDYHADGHVRGGKKGEVVFPGALWAKFPEWSG